MCGIAGILHLDRSGGVQATILAKMVAALRHRGPDDYDTWVASSGEVGLAHSRLAITDESELGRQPMRNADGTVSVVFNGEIYNHAALRRDLERRGYQFRSQTSDTEALLHAYEHWGVRCVEELRGMFAFAVWDARTKDLLLARDRIGIKPLYYAIAGSRLFFASEIKALFASECLDKQLSPAALYDYLTFLAVPAPHTLFKNISKLEAGCVLRVTSSGVSTMRRYWDSASFLNTPVVETEQAAIDNTHQLLKDAVAVMTTGRAPLAAALSGGVDSTLVVALMSQNAAGGPAITMDHEVQCGYNESPQAMKIATALRVRHVVRTVNDEDLLRAFREVSSLSHDCPLGANDVLLLFLLSKELRRSGIRVCLFGEGADELGGYPSYLLYESEYQHLRRFAGLPASVRNILFRCAPTKAKAYLDVAMGGSVASRRHVQAFSEEQKRTIWSGPGQENSYVKLRQIMNEVRDDCDDSFLRQLQHVEFRLRLPEFLLSRVDAATMAGAVEARVPFLDHSVVEYSLRLPMSLKMKQKTPKYIFRSILSRYLDGTYVEEKKIGFGRVLTPFMNNTVFRRVQREILAAREHPLFAYIDRKRAGNLLEEHQRSGQQGFPLWILYSLAKWLEVHTDYRPPEGREDIAP